MGLEADLAGSEGSPDGVGARRDRGRGHRPACARGPAGHRGGRGRARRPARRRPRHPGRICRAGSLPAFGSGWLLVPPVLALAPALWAPYSLGPVADSLLYGLAPLLAALLLVRLVGARAKDAGTGGSTGIYRALVTVTWLALAAAVIARFGEAWMGRSLAVVLALLLLIAYLVPRLAPGELRAHRRRPDRFGPGASAALQVSIAGLALVGLDALAGDDAAAAAAEGIAAVDRGARRPRGGMPAGRVPAKPAHAVVAAHRRDDARRGRPCSWAGRSAWRRRERAEPTPSDRKRRKMAGVVWRWRSTRRRSRTRTPLPSSRAFCLSRSVRTRWRSRAGASVAIETPTEARRWRTASQSRSRPPGRRPARRTLPSWLHTAGDVRRRHPVRPGPSSPRPRR